MARYFTKASAPKANWIADETWVDAQSHVPTVADHEPTFTGLLDARGDEIWRAPRPIGFGRDEEW